MTTEDIASRCSLEILEHVNFASDHCGLSLYMQTNSRPKATVVGEGNKRYKWTEESKIKYKENLEGGKKLEDFRAHALRALSPNVAETQKPNHKTVDRMVQALTNIMLGACDEELEYEVSGVWRGPRSRGENAEITGAIRRREMCRKAVERAAVEGATTTEMETIARLHKEARENVREAFQRETGERNKRIWEKMEKAWESDKAVFFREFSELAGLKPRQQLPRSLRINGEEVRRPARIQKEWVKRFKIPHVETGTEADRKYREQIEEENDRRSREDTHEHASYNQDYTVEQVQEALAKGKSEKKPGRDQIQNEMMRWGGNRLQECLTLLFTIMHRVERIAAKWKTTPFSPLYKKGEVRVPLNFRPVTYMSNIYKAYERCIDVRVRSTVILPDAQCGFRGGYGPLISLIRAQAIMRFCKANGIDLYVVFVDFKQAFERVWRGGMLDRLWKLGVKGKLWRVIKDMLTGTRTYARTNFGDTETWEVVDGIIQGSVLSAILFIIFISLIADDLRPLSPDINGERIVPQLFADDGTLYAVGEKACKIIIEGCLRWAGKFNMVLNMKKSKALTLTERKRPLYEDENHFEMAMVRNAILLGVGINGQGVYSSAYQRTLLERFVTRVQAIMKAGVKMGALRADRGMYLFNTMAQSLIKYALPLTTPESEQIRKLDIEQSRFAKNFMDFPKGTPDHAAKAELGLLDYDIQSKMAGLLMHKRIHNTGDAFTRRLVGWKKGAGKGSMLDAQIEALGDMLPGTTWEGFATIPYEVAK